MKFVIIFFCSLLIFFGVFGDTEVKVSVKEGDSVTLQINPEDIKGATDLVLRFNDTKVAEFDLEVKDSQPVYTDERFRDRLNLDRQTGSLTITNIRSEDSGEYKLEIRSSGGIKHKTFRVSVIEPSPSSHWMITGPVLAVVLLLVVVVVLCVIYKRSWKQKSRTEEKDTAEHLKNDEE